MAVISAREALAAIAAWADDMDGSEPVFLDRLRAILADVESEPVGGVTLTREEAALARSWYTGLTFEGGNLPQDDALAARLEAAS